MIHTIGDAVVCRFVSGQHRRAGFDLAPAAELVGANMPATSGTRRMAGPVQGVGRSRRPVATRLTGTGLTEAEQSRLMEPANTATHRAQVTMDRALRPGAPAGLLDEAVDAPSAASDFLAGTARLVEGRGGRGPLAGSAKLLRPGGPSERWPCTRAGPGR